MGEGCSSIGSGVLEKLVIKQHWEWGSREACNQAALGEGSREACNQAALGEGSREACVIKRDG